MGYLEDREESALEASRTYFSGLNFTELNKPDFPSDGIKAAWKGIIQCAGQAVEIILTLPTDFPDVLPKIYLASQENLPLMPHIDDKSFVCTYTRQVIFFSEDIEGILNNSIDKARKVISDGINEENTIDFVAEMLAYWDIGIQPQVLSVFDPQTTLQTLTIAEIQNNSKTIVRILAENREAADKIIANMKLTGGPTRYHPALYLSNISPFIPPFPKTNNELFEIFDLNDPDTSKAILGFLNKHKYSGYVVFSAPINGQLVLGGWFHLPQNIKEISHGFRPGHLDIDTLKTRVAGGLIQRFKLIRLDSKRIHARVGLDTGDLHNKTVCVVGCGSIGSKVAFNLVREGIGTTILVDDEVLQPENVGRHLCGISSWNKNKVDAVKSRIIDHYPDAKVICIPETFNQAYIQHSEIINSADLIISCTADVALERTLNNIFYTNHEFPPLIFSWTEPYGIASHALAIVRRSKGCFECCLSPHNLHFLREAVNSEPDTYSLNEAGCQTSFIPYSALDVDQAATISTRLSLRLLFGELSENIGVAYLGDISKAKTYKIKLSKQYDGIAAFSNITYKVEKRKDCKVCSG